MPEIKLQLIVNGRVESEYITPSEPISIARTRFARLIRSAVRRLGGERILPFK